MARRKQKKQRKPKQKSIVKRIFFIIGLLVLAIGIGVGGLFTYYIATAPEIDEEKLANPFSSKIYDIDGELFAEFGDVKRTKIEYDDLPDILIDAVTATEDIRFFKHFGIDLRRMGGAILANISRGFGAEGASTITQQVVENAFLTSDKKLKRKVQEQWLALKLEREYSKEQIMEMYLNTIFYGSGAYGVAKASEIYFDKTDLHDLTLVEAAILAGLPQRPSAYNPFENPDLMADRVDTVLKLMVRHGKISEEEAAEARQVEIASLLTDKKPAAAPHDAFLRKVRQEVNEKVDGANIDTGGLKIYTTMDRHAQEYVEFLLTDSEDNPIKYPDEDMQAGMVVLDTKTGAIQAIGGSRNRENIDGYNYALQGGRQPGSTFKPIVAFGPAIEYNKISTYHQLNDDAPYKIPGTEHEIRNWDRQNRGWTPARLALSRSLNVPTVKAFLEVENDKVKEFGENLGIKFAKDSVPVGEAIGGEETNVTPLQLAGAYRAFGNEGIYNEPYAVTKVEFPDGKVVELKPEPEAVMSDYTAYMITDMLKSALSPSPIGTGSNANIPGLHMAGKTGTTNIPNDGGVNNSWFSGYTTNYTIAVWTGYKENNKAIENTQIPHALFKHTMTEISKDIETPDFKKPDSVVEVAIEKGSNPAKLPSKYTPKENIITELFVKGYEPSSTSKKYDKLDPVDQLSATYDEDSNSILVKWDYQKNHDVTFEVSASINDEQMKKLAEIDEQAMEISEVVPGSEYEIQVIAISNEGLGKSDAKTTKVKVPEQEEEDEDENDENNENNNNEPEENPEEIPPVEGLSSSYNQDNQIIDVSWNYNGPPAHFKVVINDQQSQTVQSNGIEIEGASPGKSYKITVIPVGTNGANQGVEGEPRSVTETIPPEEKDEDVEEVSDNEPEENDSEN